MEHDPTDGSHDLHADRDQCLAQPRDLRTAERGPVGTQLQLLPQDERRGGQGDAQLIGPEARGRPPSACLRFGTCSVNTAFW